MGCEKRYRKNMSKRVLLTIVNVLSLLVAFAQDDSIRTTHQVDEVEVLAQQNDDTRSLSPHYTLSSESFSRLNITDITSALHHLPGITLKDYGGAGGMKTVSVRGLGATHTGVALDGLLLPDIQSGSIDMQQFMLSEVSSLTLNIAGNENIFQPARNISRGALLSVETGVSSHSVGGSLSVGSWGRLEPSLWLGFKSRKVSGSIGGSYLRADNGYPFTVDNGADTHRENRQNNRVSQAAVNGNVSWRLGENSLLKAFFRLSDNDRELPGAVHYYVNGNDETLRDQSALVQMTLTTRLANRLWLKPSLRWTHATQRYHAGTGNAGIQSENYHHNEYYATAVLLYEPTRQLAFDYSLDFFHNALQTTFAANPSPRRNSLLQSLSGKWSSCRFSLIASLLFSVVESVKNLSPMVSGSWKVLRNEDLYLRLSAKQMFRMPSMTEQYYYHIGQQTLRPETTRQLNLGITFAKTLPRWDWRCSADVYINKVSDKIVCIPFNMFVWRYMNLENVIGRGADVTLSSNYHCAKSHSVSLAANYSLQRLGNQSEQQDYRDLQVAYIPLHSGSATLAWTNPWVNVSATTVFASDTWTTNEHHAQTRIAGYTELSASLYRSFRLPKGALDVSVTVKNILDKQYFIVARYPMPGRNFIVNVKYEL